MPCVRCRHLRRPMHRTGSDLRLQRSDPWSRVLAVGCCMSGQLVWRACPALANSTMMCHLMCTLEREQHWVAQPGWACCSSARAGSLNALWVHQHGTFLSCRCCDRPKCLANMALSRRCACASSTYHGVTCRALHEAVLLVGVPCVSRTACAQCAGALTALTSILLQLSINFGQAPSLRRPQAGAAYVVFHKPDDARACIEDINDRVVAGKTIKVLIASGKSAVCITVDRVNEPGGLCCACAMWVWAQHSAWQSCAQTCKLSARHPLLCLQACYGTTKYCHAFLKGASCNNQDCQYLHELGARLFRFLVRVRFCYRRLVHACVLYAEA